MEYAIRDVRTDKKSTVHKMDNSVHSIIVNFTEPSSRHKNKAATQLQLYSSRVSSSNVTKQIQQTFGSISTSFTSYSWQTCMTVL